MIRRWKGIDAEGTVS